MSGVPVDPPMGNMQEKVIAALPAHSFLFNAGKPLYTIVLRMICLTLGCAALGGMVEWWYLAVTGQATFIEYIALAATELSFLTFITLGFLRFRNSRESFDQAINALQWMTFTIFWLAALYILVMVGGTLFSNGVPGRALHTALWIHPALIAMALTQGPQTAWRLGLVAVLVAVLSSVAFAFALDTDGMPHVTVVSFVQLSLSVCASTALLYVLAALREERGATRAELALMEETQHELRRSAELAQEAQAAAEQMNKSMTAFLNNISHELRTPLNGIIGFSEIIRDEMFGAHASPQYKDYAGDIAGSGAHLLGLVNDLLFFSQLNAGRVTITPEPFDIYSLLNEIADSYATQTEDAGLTIKVDEAANPDYFINLDTVVIRQILRNLISNGIKFSHAGGVITLGYRMLADNHCEIWVSDTGIGISEKEQENILQLFRRGAESDRNAVPGTGLGLAMVKMLVDMQDGIIDFETGGKCGTTVRITLPLSAQMSDADLQDKAAAR